MSNLTFELLKVAVMVGAMFLAGTWAALKMRHGEKLDEFFKWTNKAVLWAQQVYWSEPGAARKAVAMEFLKTLRDKYRLDVTDEQISVLIEAAVKEFNEKEGFGYVYLEDADGDGDEG